MATKLEFNDYGGFKGEKIAKGIVQFHDKNGKLSDTKSNLIVYTGREFLAQKISDIFDSGNPRYDYRNYKITHFGVGGDGYSQVDPTIKIGPLNTDEHLYSPLTLGPKLNRVPDYQGEVIKGLDNTEDQDTYNFYLDYYPMIGNPIPRVLKPIATPGDYHSTTLNRPEDKISWEDKIIDNVVKEFKNIFPNMSEDNETATNHYQPAWGQYSQIVRDINSDNRDLIIQYTLKIDLWDLPGRYTLLYEDGHEDLASEGLSVGISELGLFATRQQYNMPGIGTGDISEISIPTFNNDMTPNYKALSKYADANGKIEGLPLKEFWYKKCCAPKMISHITVAPKWFENRETYLIVWNILT